MNAWQKVSISFRDLPCASTANTQLLWGNTGGSEATLSIFRCAVQTWLPVQPTAGSTAQDGHSGSCPFPQLF